MRHGIKPEIEKTKLNNYKTDLHIHTCLSPCADWEMSPVNIVKRCIDCNIDIIAVCDHNSTQNSEALIKNGEKYGLKVFPGMEVCTKEEVHVLAVFEDLQSAFIMQDYVYRNLKGENVPEIFGYQVVSNYKDEVEDQCARFLLGAVNKSIWEISEKIHQIGGMCIPSHIERMAYGLISQLGYIPPDLAIDGIEIKCDKSDFRYETQINIIRSSDAHFLKDIGRRVSVFRMQKRSFKELKMALKGTNGRGISLD